LSEPQLRRNTAHRQPQHSSFTPRASGELVLTFCLLRACSCAQYLAFLLIITIILFAIGVAVSVQKNKAGDYIGRAWMAAPPDVRASVQQEFECCGLRFWNDTAAWPCPAAQNYSGSAFCYPLLVNAFERAYAHAGGAAIAFSVFMGLGIFFVVSLIRGIKRKRHEQDLEHVRHAHSVAGIMEQGGFGGAGGADGLGGGGGGSGMMGGDLEPLPSDSGLVDFNAIDAGAASMFDKTDYNDGRGGRHEYAAAEPSNQRRR
jgi:hypothetical protein